MMFMGKVAQNQSPEGILGELYDVFIQYVLSLSPNYEIPQRREAAAEQGIPNPANPAADQPEAAQNPLHVD